jgi:hypothetical protein
LFIHPTEWQGFQLNTSPFFHPQTGHPVGRLCYLKMRIAAFIVIIFLLSCRREDVPFDDIELDLQKEKYSLVVKTNYDRIYLIHDGECEAHALATRLGLIRASDSPGEREPINIAGKYVTTVYYGDLSQYMKLIKIGILTDNEWVLCIQRY